MHDLFSPRAHFRAFGFVVLRGTLSDDEATALTTEADRAVRDATGDRYLVDDGQGGITGHYIPPTGDRTPMSLALLQRFAPLVEHLAGVPMLPALTQYALFFEMAGWHTDTGHAVPSVKVAVYLEPLDGHNGALRVLPGSHRLDQRVLTDLLHGPAFQDEARAREATQRVPAHVIASRRETSSSSTNISGMPVFGGRHRLQTRRARLGQTRHDRRHRSTGSSVGRLAGQGVSRTLIAPSCFFWKIS